MQNLRVAAVAGSFYPSDPGALRDLVSEFLEPGLTVPAAGAISPHAGLIYSGACAGRVLSRVEIPATAVIIAPNHTGAGDGRIAATWGPGAFQTPLGEVPVDAKFTVALTAVTKLVGEDQRPHLREHAIEVILPFIQVLAPGTAIVPLVLPWASWEPCRLLAEALAVVIAAWETPVLLIASSDMTHYETAAQALSKDTVALEAIAGMDGRGLLDVCDRMGISMCGRGPSAVVLEACRLLGATTATTADYRHSGLVTGDHSSVVSYAGVVVA